MLVVTPFTFNPFSENTFVVHCSETKEAVIIDPGCYTAVEKKELADFIEAQDLKVTKLLNTHAHIDHVLGNAWVKNTYQVPLFLHAQDQATLAAVETYAPVYGFPNYEKSEAEELLKDNEAVEIGKGKLDILFVPGHAPGHVALYAAEEGFCINGDCLFNGSIGRTDLPGGDFDTLIESIKSRLFTLPDDTTVYCGHGPATTIGHEKRYNPFVKG